MARKDKSFFGKIMGGSVTEEDPEPVAVVQSYADTYSEDDEDDDEVTEILEDELVEDDEEESEPEEAINEPTETELPARKPAAAVTNEEWMADYEGQLNIDMYQTKDNVILKSTIAGVRPEDIDITVANDMVTVKGARRKEENIPQEDYFYQECYWGNFSRSVIVPVDIDSEQIEADLKDGILTIIIPKAAKAKTKKVKVRGL